MNKTLTVVISCSIFYSKDAGTLVHTARQYKEKRLAILNDQQNLEVKYVILSQSSPQRHGRASTQKTANGQHTQLQKQPYNTGATDKSRYDYGVQQITNS
jgi:hypothetical protein